MDQPNPRSESEHPLFGDASRERAVAQRTVHVARPDPDDISADVPPMIRTAEGFRQLKKCWNVHHVTRRSSTNCFSNLPRLPTGRAPRGPDLVHRRSHEHG